MASNSPGEPVPPPDRPRLATPPSARYGTPGAAGAVDAPRPSAAGPIARAVLLALAGATALVIVGAILASTFGLLMVAGVMGAGIGLVLARARVAGAGEPALAPRVVRWLAVGLALGAVVVAALVTWLIARQEGGTLGLVDYLLMTFGPFVPAEALLAAIGAAWGAGAGPIQRG